MFIELTRSTGKKMSVNVTQICFYQDQNDDSHLSPSRIVITGQGYDVRETYQEIQEMVNRCLPMLHTEIVRNAL